MSSKMLIITYRITWHHSSEVYNLHFHCHKNLKSHVHDYYVGLLISCKYLRLNLVDLGTNRVQFCPPVGYLKTEVETASEIFWF
jgi:hypothetical protein